MSGIGMNLQGIAYWSTEHPFLDRFKTSGGWAGYDSTGKLVTAVPLDHNGYPTALPTGVASILSCFDVDPPASGQSDTYVLTYTGKATVNVGGAVLSQADGRIVFRIDADSGYDFVQLSNIDPAHPVTDIHVVRQDQEGLLAAGGIFNPEFLEKATGWDTLRLKDWEGTDSSTLTSWNERTTLSSASWSANTTGKAGVPIEVQVALANQAHSSIWINVPAHADDDYVRQLMTYVHDHLDHSLSVTLEYSNEVWNWGYEQAHYALTQGDQLWGTDKNGDGKVDSNDPAEHVSDGWVQFYGYRAAQVAAIAKGVFGNDGARLNTVLATQTTFTGLEQSILTGVAKANVGTTPNLFNQYAVTTYFGLELDGFTADDRAKVLAWAKQGAAGLDAAFHEMQFGGGGFSQSFSLADLKAIYAYQAQVAAKNGMAMVAYEGGAHLTANLFDQADQATVVDFMNRLESDPRMGQLYAEMASDFAAAGGKLLTAFQDTSNTSIWGDWGVLGSIYDDGSPRYDALRQAQGGSTPPLGSAPPATGGTTITYGDGDGWLTGGTGSDTITAGNGNSHIWGNAPNAAGQADGADVIVVGGGTNYINGNAGDDQITVGFAGSTGANRIYGGGGNDLIVLKGAGANYVNGNLGNDRIDASAATGDNLLRGGQGDDLVRAGHGHDQLFGDIGADTLVAGSGTNHLAVMTGGTGADLFVFGGVQAPAVIDGHVYVAEVTDYTPGTDHLALAFQPSAVTTAGGFGSLADAQAYATTWLAHHGAKDVLAAQVGSDTMLFFDGAGTATTIDSVVKLDHVTATSLSAGDFVQFAG